MYWSFTMESKIRIAVLVAFVTYLSVCTAETTLELKASTTKPKIGDTVELKCNVKNIQPGKFIKWQKIIPAMDDQGTEETIIDLATNEVPSNNVNDLGRYSASATPQDQPADYLFTLNISNIQHEDSGDIVCTMPGLDLQDKVTISTLVPPSSAQLVIVKDGAEKEYGEDEEVMMEKGDVIGLKCKVDGGFPRPKVMVTVGGKDITNMFEKPVVEEIHKQGPSGKFYETSFNTVVEKSSLEIGYKHAFKGLACQGEVEGEGTKVDSRIVIKMKGFPPQLECPSHVVAYSYQRGVNITCQVSAQPPITGAAFKWFLHNSPSLNKSESVKNGETNGHYTGNMDKTENGTIISLYMDRVFPQMFRTYTFVAVNEYGKGETTVKLTETANPNPGSLTDSGATTRWSLGVMLGLVILAIAHSS